FTRKRRASKVGKSGGVSGLSASDFWKRKMNPAWGQAAAWRDFPLQSRQAVKKRPGRIFLRPGRFVLFAL
ncbi:MAG: hypothetical protein RR452_09745, partial [Clostridia bacterium]